MMKLMKFFIQDRGTDQITIGSRVVATMDGQARSVLECLTPLSSFDIFFSLALHGSARLCMALAAVLNLSVPIYFSNCCGRPAVCCLLIMSATTPLNRRTTIPETMHFPVIYGQVIQRPVGSLNIWSEPKLQVPTACCSTFGR